MRITILAGWHGFGGTFAYTTRWRLDLSTPPLKIAIVLPIKPRPAKGQETCVRNGRTEIAGCVPGDRVVGCSRFVQSHLNICHPAVPVLIT